MSVRAPQILERSAGSEDNVALGFTLPTGVALTGTPTVEEVGSSDLTLTGKVVNTATLTLHGTSYAAGAAVQFHRAGGTAGKDYIIRVAVSTDATPAEVLVVLLRLTVTRDTWCPPAAGQRC